MKKNVKALLQETQKELKLLGQALSETSSGKVSDNRASEEAILIVFGGISTVLEKFTKDLRDAGLSNIHTLTAIQDGYEWIYAAWKRYLLESEDVSNDEFNLLRARVYIEGLWIVEQLIALFQGMARPMNLFKWALEPKRSALQQCRNKAIDVYLCWTTESNSNEVMRLCSLLDDLIVDNGLSPSNEVYNLIKKVQQASIQNLGSDSTVEKERYLAEVINPLIAALQANINLCQHREFKETAADGLLCLWGIEPEKYKSLVNKWSLDEEEYARLLEISKGCGFRSIQVGDVVLWPQE